MQGPFAASILTKPTGFFLYADDGISGTHSDYLWKNGVMATDRERLRAAALYDP